MKKLGFDLILLGAPAAGKDTQAGLLGQKYKLHPVETGKELSRIVQTNSAEARQLKKTFSLGHAAPVKIIKKIISRKLNAAKPGYDHIFIGNPRLKPEAQFLVKLLKQRKKDFLVIYLTLPESEIKLRSKRRFRDAADTIYIQNRINYHKKQVSKTVKYFKSLGKLVKINGQQGINQVAADINKAVDDYARPERN